MGKGSAAPGQSVRLNLDLHVQTVKGLAWDVEVIYEQSRLSFSRCGGASPDSGSFCISQSAGSLRVSGFLPQTETNVTRLLAEIEFLLAPNASGCMSIGLKINEIVTSAPGTGADGRPADVPTDIQTRIETGEVCATGTGAVPTTAAPTQPPAATTNPASPPVPTTAGTVSTPAPAQPPTATTPLAGASQATPGASTNLAPLANIQISPPRTGSGGLVPFSN
jgi:hypothetical protein